MTAAPEPYINPKALAWTIGVHVLLLILFMLWRYTPPVSATVPEMGMEVNLGTSDNGSGTDQPMQSDDPAPDAASISYKAAPQQSVASKDMLQSDDPNDASVSSASTTSINRNNTQTNEKKRPINKEQQADNNAKHQERPRYVYNGATGKGGNGAMQNLTGTSEGNTTGNGDRGVPNGTPGATNYTGSPGNGNGGISHTLTGRTISPDRFVAEFHEGGKVIVKVAVDRNGNIISTSIKSSPSPELSKIAIQKLKQAKFSASPDAAPEQFGLITIVFKTRA
ncbi:MAG: energy transducer TonB [Taibaiella sp.]|nr:energy transducer TonB [Taibaiella sp.]